MFTETRSSKEKSGSFKLNLEIMEEIKNAYRFPLQFPTNVSRLISLPGTKQIYFELILFFSKFNNCEVIAFCQSNCNSTPHWEQMRRTHKSSYISFCIML